MKHVNRKFDKRYSFSCQRNAKVFRDLFQNLFNSVYSTSSVFIMAESCHMTTIKQNFIGFIINFFDCNIFHYFLTLFQKPHFTKNESHQPSAQARNISFWVSSLYGFSDSSFPQSKERRPSSRASTRSSSHILFTFFQK